ncbi:uncharacterized protein LOC114944731 [Nylanderia fulva]|uniref:uncharacterized protein LOC114944731 n=1 Tax=Nylanderia fulva TaxID=613905 RepID=UPI0010FB73A8|nr:uncharacterized protein LOC114944731 [Nylanderia fulva]
MAERSCGIGIVAEPYRISDRNWVKSTDGSAAIVRRNVRDFPPLNLIEAGGGFVVASWGSFVIIGIYLPPSLERGAFGGRLKTLERQIAKHHSRPMIIAGNFNAKSTAWGSPHTDWRGGEVSDWAAQCDVILLNERRENTCVRWQGGSIVDLTWMTRSAIRMAQSWRVAMEIETLSDHRYIEISVATTTKEVAERRRKIEASFRRWALRKLDKDMFMAAINAALLIKEGETGDLETHRAWLDNTMQQACEAAMPRVKTRSPKHAYWWSEDIVELRQSSDRARRNIRKRQRYALSDPEGLEDAWDAYRNARDVLRASIRKAKAKAWEELISSLDEDPWGRPYK